MPNGFPEGDFRIINQDTGVRLFTHDNGFASESIDAKSSFSSATGKIKANIALNPSFKVGSPGAKGDDDLWWFHESNYLMSHLEVTNGRSALQAEYYPDARLKVLERYIDFIDPETPIKDLKISSFSERIVKALAALFPEKSSNLSSEELSRLSLVEWVKGSSTEMQPMTKREVALLVRDRIEKGRMKARLTLWGWTRPGVSKWQAEDGYIFLEGQPEKVLTLVEYRGSYRATLAGRGASNQTWRFEPKS